MTSFEWYARITIKTFSFIHSTWGFPDGAHQTVQCIHHKVYDLNLISSPKIDLHSPCRFLIFPWKLEMVLRTRDRLGECTCWHQNISTELRVGCYKVILTNYGDAVNLFKDFPLMDERVIAPSFLVVHSQNGLTIKIFKWAPMVPAVSSAKRSYLLRFFI